MVSQFKRAEREFQSLAPLAEQADGSKGVSYTGTRPVTAPVFASWELRRLAANSEQNSGDARLFKRLKTSLRWPKIYEIHVKAKKGCVFFSGEWQRRVSHGILMSATTRCRDKIHLTTSTTSTTLPSQVPMGSAHAGAFNYGKSLLKL